MDIVIPIGIYCYFGLDLIEKLRSFRVTKRKASRKFHHTCEIEALSINAILICQKPTQRKNHCETLFAGHTPSSVDSTAKLHKIVYICKFCIEFLH